jgi:signal transduction histidine kinase
VLGADPDSFDLTLQIDVPGVSRAAVVQVQERIQAAERAQRDAAAESRKLVRSLRSAGLTGADTAAALGVSPQRVSQLEKV